MSSASSAFSGRGPNQPVTRVVEAPQGSIRFLGSSSTVKRLMGDSLRNTRPSGAIFVLSFALKSSAMDDPLQI
jgi:hypothetical protein